MWAHAEYVKVLRSIRDGAGCDAIPEVRKRYVDDKVKLRMSAWSKAKPMRIAGTRDIIRIAALEEADLVWTANAWRTKETTPLKATGLGVYFHDFEPGAFPLDSRLVFTFHYTGADRWEGRDYEIRVL
ncbi:MAG: hypothetical protein HY894_05925 [Deltaproteobacteria bacterium]|nr:hypothetical protein [Deltaproteobacteria bacterium]